MRNPELIKRADLALADLTSNGGLLNPEQANQFIRTLIKQPTLLNAVRTVEMGAPQRNINKIQFGSRVLRAGTSATALSESERSKPSTAQVQLNTREVVAEVWLPYDVIEDNIERGSIGTNVDGSGGQGTPASGGLIDTIQTLIIEAASRDLEELAIQGDASSTDDYLALTDGFIETLNDAGNVVDNGGAILSRSTFKAAMKALPPQYMRNRASMVHAVSVDNEIEYRDTLAGRETGLGDNTITGFAPVFAFGVPLLPVMLMPEDHGIFTNPQNMIFGIQRALDLEYDKDVSARVYKIVVTARIDFQIEEATASVVYNNIGQTA